MTTIRSLVYYWVFIPSNPEGDDLDQDVVFDDEEGIEYEVNYNNSEDSFGADDGGDDDGPMY